MNGWPDPEGLGISPPNEFGIVLYNHPFDPERSILDELDAQALVEVACPDCGVLRGMVLPTVCNCTQDGLPYCGRAECDIDWCWYCGDEYTDPCPRHEEVDHV